ncbi:MAG: hypothetical protein L3J06_05570 [Cyclobacteriaceae bacterium]|nr:hypothetical protein [Cyclobacteriaceae bacterium]
MKMIRKPTYAGLVKNKDVQDILFWALEKTPSQRLSESWRLHCINNNMPFDAKIDKTVVKASLRNEQ